MSCFCRARPVEVIFSGRASDFARYIKTFSIMEITCASNDAARFVQYIRKQKYDLAFAYIAAKFSRYLGAIEACTNRAMA